MMVDYFDTTDPYYDFFLPKSDYDLEYLLEKKDESKNIYHLLANMLTDAKLADSFQNVGKQNVNEEIYQYPTPVNFGVIESPPLSRAPGGIGIDLIPFLYNDMGRTHQAVGPPIDPPANRNGPNGFYGWYDGGFNPRSGVPYPFHASRQLLLGKVKGDDPVVLDWIIYWWLESKINTMSPVSGTTGISSTNWTDPEDDHYWIYVLLNQVPNMVSMKYLLWGNSDFGATTTEIENQNDDFLSIVQQYPGAWTYGENGKTYLGLYVFSLEGIRFVYDADSGAVNTIAYLKDLASKCQAIGYDGVFLLARQGDYFNVFPDDTLLPAGVIVGNGEYSGRYDTDDNYNHLYSDYANTVDFPTSRGNILNICTDALSVAPHPSNFDLQGSNSSDWQILINKACNHIVDHGMRRVLTIYGSGELGEAGKGLIPEEEDFFEYLNVIKGISSFKADDIDFDSLVQSLGEEFAAITGAWQSFAAGWGSTGSPITLGNGTLDGFFVREGNSISLRMRLIIGSTTVLGTGDYAFALPHAAVSSYPSGMPLTGWAYVENNGIAGYMAVPQLRSDKSTFTLRMASASIDGGLVGTVGATSPFTFDDNDFIYVSIGPYECAP